MFEVKEYIKASKDYVKTRDINERIWKNKCWSETLKKAYNYSAIALYGAGTHTKDFLEFMSLNRKMWDIVLKKICCIVSLENSGNIFEIPVVTIEEARETYNIDLIIISSRIYQEVIYNRLKSYQMPEVDLIKIYPEDYSKVSTERSYAYYDENHLLRTDIPFDHLQRYGWALGFVRNKIVFDMACGSGYGSAWMASIAEKVIGIDVSEAAIEHARNMYSDINCNFICGDICKVELPEKADVIVSFETIEHIKDENEYFCAIKRLLKPDGILLISTPLSNKDGKSDSNPFHINEYTKERFHALISRYFNQILWYRQDAENDYAISIDDGSMETEKIGAIVMLAVCSGIIN